MKSEIKRSFSICFLLSEKRKKSYKSFNIDINNAEQQQKENEN